MAYLLFIDESGHDRVKSPYEVLAGIAIKDRSLWPMINRLHQAEINNFGRRYSKGYAELKGQKLLKSKVFHHASLNVEVKPEEVASLAKHALDDGATARVKHLKALALAKLAYVAEVLDICHEYDCRAFCSIVETDSAKTSTGGLRKDYAYLFERYFYFLEDLQFAYIQENHQGIIVFDELEKTKSHLLVDQARVYFKESATGRHRASLIVPEPFFVHSELTTGVQVADLVAYIVSWGFRTTHMNKPARQELSELVQKVARLRTTFYRDRQGNPAFQIWSFAHITDLRTRMEREA